MGVSLVKGQKVDLTKGNPDLTIINFGLGWAAHCDLDYACASYDENGKMIPDSIVHFRCKSNSNRSIWLDKDDTTGGGGLNVPKENCRLDLRNIPPEVHEVKFGGWVYSGARNFGESGGAYMQLRNISKFPEAQPNTPAYKATVKKGTIIADYQLGEEFTECTAVCLGSVYRHNGEWKVRAIGDGMGGGINAMFQYFKTGEITPVTNTKSFNTTDNNRSSSDALSGRLANAGAEAGRRIGNVIGAILGR